MKDRFGKRSTAEEVTDGIDLRGKTAFVTGCNSGIGFETIRVLALRGARIIGVARTQEKAERACQAVVHSASTGTAVPLACDQLDLESVVACADAVRAVGRQIDILVCNAGIGHLQPGRIDGIEKHFLVNHLSHFILVNRLLDLVIASPQGRVVVVGSSAGFLDAPKVGIDFDSITGARDLKPGEAYGQSKLANALFARQLSQRLSLTTATANVVHPGVVATPMNRWHELSRPRRIRNRLVMWSRGYGWKIKNVEQGAATTCYVATNPALAGISGAYFENCRASTPGGHMRDDAMAAKLWNVSRELAAAHLLPADTKARA